MSAGEAELRHGEAPGDRLHAFVWPLALAVVAVAAAAVVISLDRTGTDAAPRKPVVAVRPYRGGKLPRHARRSPPPPPPVSAPSWVMQELGVRSETTPLVQRISRDLRIAITRKGFQIDYRDAHLARAASGLGASGPLERHRYGATRRYRTALEATVILDSATSYMVVGRRRGDHRWTWAMTTNLRPRVRPDGGLILQGRDSFLLRRPRVFDVAGNDVTPAGLRWRLRRIGARGYVLMTRLDDRRLPLPYVISG